MEHKLGQVFQYDGQWYQCVEGWCCNGCAFDTIKCDEIDDIVGHCFSGLRNDGKPVVFKKLEKIDKPYRVLIQGEWKCFQRYHTYMKPIIYGNLLTRTTGEYNFIEIEINQIDKDMERNEKNKYDKYMDIECIPLCNALNSLPGVKTTSSCCGHCKNKFMIFFDCDNAVSLSIIARSFNRRYSGTNMEWIIEVDSDDSGNFDYFLHSVEPYTDNTVMDKDVSRLVENIQYWSSDAFKEYFINGVENKVEMLVKPFDLNAAKDGKSVCTKDGRPARIICFDTKGGIYPIIALVEDNGWEVTIHYNEEGRSCNKDSNEDLMMAPEIFESEPIKLKQTSPRSWEEFCEKYPIKKGEAYISTSSNIYSAHYDCKERYSKSWCASKEEAEAFLALMQLRQLRNAWVGDWEPSGDDYYAIVYEIKDGLRIGFYEKVNKSQSFPTRIMAEHFFSSFTDLCQTEQILLYI